MSRGSFASKANGSRGDDTDIKELNRNRNESRYIVGRLKELQGEEEAASKEEIARKPT